MLVAQTRSIIHREDVTNRSLNRTCPSSELEASRSRSQYLLLGPETKKGLDLDDTKTQG